jgi:hypothetical protein
MDDLTSYLKSKNYFVNLRLENKLLIVDFPAKVVGDIPISAYSTTYERKKTYVSISGEDYTSRIVCPKYASKLLIRSDIILRCQIIGFSEELIIKDFQTKANELINLDDNELEQENKLIVALGEGIRASMLGGTVVDEARLAAEQANVLEGYDAFFKFAEKGLNYDKHLRKELSL